MKKKILLVLSLMFVFCLGMAVSAYTTHTSASATSSCCCCSGDSCPLKAKGETKDAEPKNSDEKKGNCCCKE